LDRDRASGRGHPPPGTSTRGWRRSDRRRKQEAPVGQRWGPRCSLGRSHVPLQERIGLVGCHLCSDPHVRC
jgi:hypothetical protein